MTPLFVPHAIESIQGCTRMQNDRQPLQPSAPQRRTDNKPQYPKTRNSLYFYNTERLQVEDGALAMDLERVGRRVQYSPSHDHKLRLR
jgi:hypothetical protein